MKRLDGTKVASLVSANRENCPIFSDEVRGNNGNRSVIFTRADEAMRVDKRTSYTFGRFSSC